MTSPSDFCFNDTFGGDTFWSTLYKLQKGINKHDLGFHVIEVTHALFFICFSFTDIKKLDSLPAIKVVIIEFCLRNLDHDPLAPCSSARPRC